MATWILTTTEKKNVEEIEFWYKDGKTIKRTTGFRWGTVYCESDERPEAEANMGCFRAVIFACKDSCKVWQ